MAPETKTGKAERLIRDDCVKAIAVGSNAAVFAVKGDTRSYLVTVLSPDAQQLASRLAVDPASCPCEARGPCSHILAATAVFRATREQG